MMKRRQSTRLGFLVLLGIMILCGGLPQLVYGQTRVDIMVLYTSQARTAAGGQAGILSRIDAAITQANQSFANSDARMVLNLVHTAELPFTESTSMSTMLGSLRNNATAQTLRNRYGADLVALLTGGTNTGGVGGVAYQLAPPFSWFSEWAYSVTRQDQALFHTFAHEVGHNLGCLHDPANASGATGAYSYSYGHRFNAGGVQYRTVMAYAPGTRLSHFSNPSIRVGGVATGTSTRDNARTIRNTRGTVSAFRAEVPTFWFRAIALDNRVMLRWAQPTESGFDSDNVMVRNDTSAFPESPFSGSFVYSGTDTSVLHTGLPPGVTRYYSIFVQHEGDWVIP